MKNKSKYNLEFLYPWERRLLGAVYRYRAFFALRIAVVSLPLGIAPFVVGWSFEALLGGLGLILLALGASGAGIYFSLIAKRIEF